ncbi:MAG: hypothetical protein M1828_000828 [Chrysothrix sp. TS-e1954]|nr:MAG: hypothetical protein M1828_000828 [Chrysothrix sp. TS-e1954]
MARDNEFQSATVNRSIRSIKAELAFLTDASVLPQATLQTILTQLPQETPLGAPIPLQTTPIPSSSPASNARLNPTNGINNLSLHNNDEKQRQPSYTAPQQSPPPPAYPSAPAPPPQQPPPLCHATALYAYTPSDTGDLALQPNDLIAVSEYMNAEWWKGTSVRTGQEGIFPRSYVRVEEAKQGGGYGNLPMDVAQGGGAQGAGGGKVGEQGKKFGRKLGNAAIFGAGATIGGDIVNSIF